MSSLDEIEPCVGDKIVATRTFEVVDVFDSFRTTYRVQDIASGERFTLTQTGSLSVAIAKRAERNYKMGDVLSGPEVDAWNAPVGAVITTTSDSTHVYSRGFTLHGERQWISRLGSTVRTFRSGLASYRIVYLPNN